MYDARFSLYKKASRNRTPGCFSERYSLSDNIFFRRKERLRKISSERIAVRRFSSGKYSCYKE